MTEWVLSEMKDKQAPLKKGYSLQTRHESIPRKGSTEARLGEAAHGQPTREKTIQSVEKRQKGGRTTQT